MKIVIYGKGDHARYTAEIIEMRGEHEIQEIRDSRDGIIGEAGIVAIGDNWTRANVFGQIYDYMKDRGMQYEYQIINAIHPSCIISKNVSFGYGIVAMAGCIFNTGAVVHSQTFFATGAQIEHDCMIKHFASISAGSILGGHVVVEEYAAVTLGCTVFDRVKIGRNSVVGSGSLVTKDVPPNVLVYGSPARVIRERKEGERFLK